MQLCHTHRQLLSRSTLRWYSAGPSLDAIAASDVQVPTRLKRPVASTLGGINIRTSRLLLSPILIVFIPIPPPFFFFQKMSWYLHDRFQINFVTQINGPVRMSHGASPQLTHMHKIFLW